MWFINIIYWLQAFIAPVILLGLIGIGVANSEETVMVFLSAGALIGIIVAEYIRRKVGLSRFFGGLYGRNEMDEKFKKKDR